MQMLTSGVGLASGPYICGKLIDLVNIDKAEDMAKQYWPAFIEKLMITYLMLKKSVKLYVFYSFFLFLRRVQ